MEKHESKHRVRCVKDGREEREGVERGRGNYPASANQAGLQQAGVDAL